MMILRSTILLMVISAACVAQDDLMDELAKSEKPQTNYASSTFKGSRIINGQSIETRGKGELEFIFAHRFGYVSSGSYELFGLDQAFVRLGLEYGITDNFGVGFGRNSFDKTMDGYLRYKLIKQSNGGVNFPVTITAFGSAALRTSPRTQDATYDIQLVDRLAYTAQVLIARKFSPNFSMQIMPTLVHKNTVDKKIETNNVYALGFAGRLKISGSIALTSEYYHRFNVGISNPYYNAVGVGIDIETGGHVFQLIFTNTRGLMERAFITETEGDVRNGDFSLGFNVTRAFQVKKSK
jgi:hypothetical protein